MFKRENRLVPGTRFNNPFLSCPQFIFKWKKNGLLINRFGIVVSKKVDKRAVVRNKIKRLFRHALVDLNKNMTSGHDILFIARPGILNKTKEENQEFIKDTLGKAGLIKNKNI